MNTSPFNPAVKLRETLVGMDLGGFLRWDTRGRCLLISDAPRRDPSVSVRPAVSGIDIVRTDGLLCFDLSRSSYESLLTFPVPAGFRNTDALDWQTWLLLERILRHPADDQYCDIPLLRAAMLASAQGPHHAGSFCVELRRAYAAGLRTRRLASCRAAAALILMEFSDGRQPSE